MDKDTNHNNRIVMLGTGNAMATRCYNTCFVVCAGTERLLVDAGGGNGILTQLERAGMDAAEIHDMYLTHAHTDHILGAVWMVRLVVSLMLKGTYQGRFTVYGHDKALHVLSWICRMTLPRKYVACMDERVTLREVHDGERLRVGGMELLCFDIRSTKEKQYGFRLRLPDGTVVACLGDEPYNAANRACVAGADWLLCEAFCLYRDRAVFKPYEKHHSTALEAGRLAAGLGVGNLLLYHTEDKTLPTRKAAYTAEAAQGFAGRVCVPDDLETVYLTQAERTAPISSPGSN